MCVVPLPAASLWPPLIVCHSGCCVLCNRIYSGSLSVTVWTTSGPVHYIKVCVQTLCVCVCVLWASLTSFVYHTGCRGALKADTHRQRGTDTWILTNRLSGSYWVWTGGTPGWRSVSSRWAGTGSGSHRTPRFWRGARTAAAACPASPSASVRPAPVLQPAEEAAAARGRLPLSGHVLSVSPERI